MSALANIGYGQNTTDAEWDRIKDKYPYNTSAPKPPDNNINLDLAKKELKDAFSDALDKDVDNVISGSAEQIASFENYVKTLGTHKVNADVTGNKKNIEESSEYIKNRLKNNLGLPNFIKNIPKHLSYDGSVVLCVLLSMQEVAQANMANLPIVDQTLIKELLKDKRIEYATLLDVRFDERKDFIFTFKNVTGEDFVLVLLNSVAHPTAEDLRAASEVPVEKDGDKIAVGGGKIVLDKKGIKKLIGVEPTKNTAQTEDIPRRQPVSGRNAFEIRSDVLQMALDYTINSEDTYTPNEVIDIAKKFYTFVENRR